MVRDPEIHVHCRCMTKTNMVGDGSIQRPEEVGHDFCQSCDLVCTCDYKVSLWPYHNSRKVSLVALPGTTSKVSKF